MRDIKIVNIDGLRKNIRTTRSITRANIRIRNRLKVALVMAIANRNVEEREGVSISHICEEALVMWLKQNDLEAYQFSARKDNSEEGY